MNKEIYDKLMDWALNHSGLNYYDQLYGDFLLDRDVLIFPLPLFIFLILVGLTMFLEDRSEREQDWQSKKKFETFSLVSFGVTAVTAISLAIGSVNTNLAAVDTSSLYLSQVYQSLSKNQQLYLSSKLDEHFLKQIGDKPFPNDYKADKLVKIDYIDFKNIAKDVAYVAGDDVLIKEYFKTDAILQDNYERLKSLYEKTHKIGN